MHKALLFLALGTALVVAGVTVQMQVRAQLRAYELAREKVRLVELREACDARRLRVQARWSPELVLRRARELRRWRAPFGTGAAPPQA